MKRRIFKKLIKKISINQPLFSLRVGLSREKIYYAVFHNYIAESNGRRIVLRNKETGQSICLNIKK